MSQQAQAEPLWKKAFPEFEMDVAIPEGFEDVSWRHNACPSFLSESLGIELFVNYKDPKSRDVPDGPRFIMFNHADGEPQGDAFLVTDSFEEVESAIEERRASQAPKVG